MPRNKKESLIFTTLMCFLMVTGMSGYNLALHGQLTLANLLHGLLPGFCVAFLLDVFIVGVLAKKLAFKFAFAREKQLYLMLSISTLMIIGMVTFMSLFGILMQGGGYSEIMTLYPHTWLMNFIAALPYQLLLVGPLSRKFLSYLQHTAENEGNA